MSKLPLSHYSPVFANKNWADSNEFVSYFSCAHSSTIKKTKKGRKQWGRQRGIYSWEVEKSLDQDLENHVSLIYKKILSYNEISIDERFIWSQFLLSQLIRTPTFIRYEAFIMKTKGIENKPARDRVGCKECGDLNFVASRDWVLLIAHKDDYFVRTDNPILQTGFIERPETCLFYPLNPRICFVACSMRNSWDAYAHIPNQTIGHKLEKGDAHRVNFYFAKAANNTLIISPEHDGSVAETMFSDILGLYPQPPFPLHNINVGEDEEAFESIRMIMSKKDGVNYTTWQPFELEPYYQTRK